MPKLIKIAKDAVKPLVIPGIRQLKDMAEGLQTSIENFEFGLDGGLQADFDRFKNSDHPMTEEELKIAIEQDTENLQLARQRLTEVNIQLQRLEAINSQSKEEANAFHIENDLTREQYKSLITLVEQQRENTEDPKEKLFLDKILQSAGTFKDAIDIGRKVDPVTIPILEDEVQYAKKLAVIFKNPEVAKNPEVINKILNIQSIQEDVSTNKKLSTDEKMILDGLCTNLINDYNSNNENVDAAIKVHIDQAMEASQDIKITTGFKGFINSICDLVGCGPAFTISNSAIIGKMQAMKQELAEIKESVSNEDIVDHSHEDELNTSSSMTGPG